MDENIKTGKKEKIKSWLKNPYNFAFVLIFLFIVFLRLYYFWITKNQPLWWDESEYMSAAKHYAGLVDYTYSSQRFPGLPLVASVFFIIGASEPVMRFFINFLPSLLAVFLIWLCIREMYPDKRIALVSLAIMGVLWESVFYSNRFQTENWGLIFQALAFFVLFRSYIKKEKSWFITPKYSLVWIFVLSFASVFFRQGSLIFFPPLILFIVVLNKSKIFTKRNSVVIGVLVLAAILFFIFVPITLPQSGVFSKTGLFAYYHPEEPLAWNNLSVFYGFYQSTNWLPSILYYAFLLGVLVVLMEFFLYYDRLKKIAASPDDIRIKSNLFGAILIILTLAFFIFIQRPNPFEFRWFFPFLFGMLPLTSIGVISFSDYASKLFGKKSFSIVFISIILILGMYTQVAHSDMIVKAKIDSYIQLKEAGLWIKENSNKQDVVLSRSPNQITYYSERRTYNYDFRFNETSFLELINQTHPKYIEESALEPSIPAFMTSPSNELKNMLNPVKVWYADSQQQQPILIIYQVNYTRS